MKNISDVAYLLKVLSDETRLKIIKMLASEELCACHILEEFEITQPTLSYHMKMLVDSGMVKSEKEGNLTRYALDQSVMKDLSEFFGLQASKKVTVRDMVNCK